MAQININCPHCQSEMEGEAEWIGQEAACPFCKKNFVISRAPVRPTLVRTAVPESPASQSTESPPPAVPPKSGKRIVLLSAIGAVVLLLAAGGAWFAFSGSSPDAAQPKTAAMKPAETPAAKPVEVPPLVREIDRKNYDEIDFALIAAELKKDPTTNLRPQIGSLMKKCRNHFIRNGDWKRYVQMVHAMREVMPQETQHFSSEIEREIRELTEHFHRSLAARQSETVRETLVEQLEQIDPKHPLAVKYREDQKQGVSPGAGAPMPGNPPRRSMPPVFQLRMAVLSGNVILTKKLLESGVDLNHPSINDPSKRRRLMTVALSNCRNASSNSPKRQKLVGCILLLQKHGVEFLPEEQDIARTIPELSEE